MRFLSRWSSKRSRAEGVDADALRDATQPERRRRQPASLEEAREQAERLNELAVLGLFLHSAGTVEEMLGLFLERSPRVTGAIVTYPLLLDRRRDVLHAAPLATLQDSAIEQASAAAETNLVDLEYPLPVRSWRRTVMDSGEVAVTDDLQEVLGDVLPAEACEAVRRELQVTRVAAVPLVMEGELFGLCLFLYSGREPDIEVLELTAGHCTLALKDILGNEEGSHYGGIDPVTWVHTRNYLLQAMDAEIVRARRFDRSLTLVLFDIDEFAEFNETFGHTLGDRLLRASAMAISGFVAPPEVVARYGGDQFALLLPETNRATAVQLTAAIVNKLQSLSVLDSGTGESLGVSVTAAMAAFPDDGGSRDELLAAAEIAMREAKEEKRLARQAPRELTPVQQLRLINRRLSA